MCEISLSDLWVPALLILLAAYHFANNGYRRIRHVPDGPKKWHPFQLRRYNTR